MAPFRAAPVVYGLRGEVGVDGVRVVCADDAGGIDGGAVWVGEGGGIEEGDFGGRVAVGEGEGG